MPKYRPQRVEYLLDLIWLGNKIGQQGAILEISGA